MTACIACSSAHTACPLSACVAGFNSSKCGDECEEWCAQSYNCPYDCPPTSPSPPPSPSPEPKPSPSPKPQPSPLPPSHSPPPPPPPPPSPSPPVPQPISFQEVDLQVTGGLQLDMIMRHRQYSTACRAPHAQQMQQARANNASISRPGAWQSPSIQPKRQRQLLQGWKASQS